MEITSAKIYDVDESDARIKAILDSSEAFEEISEIPSRDRLTYKNGFYVNCTAVFIDIRGSSKLPETHTRPVLGKIYRSYVSEAVAVLQSSKNCREIFICGDCVNGIFNTPLKADINEAFETAAKLNSLIKNLNWRLEKRNYAPIKCGIGMSYGRALMIKAGYNGSGVNEVIWMGDVVNEASNLCHKGNRDLRAPVQIAEVIRNNLREKYQGFCSPIYDGLALTPSHYEANIINEQMETWLESHKTKGTTLDFASLLGGL